MSYIHERLKLYMGVTSYGTKRVTSTECVSYVLIGKHCSKVDITSDDVWSSYSPHEIAQRVCVKVLTSWQHRDAANKCVPNVCRSTAMMRDFNATPSNKRLAPPFTEMMADQSRTMARHCRHTGKLYDNLWVPEQYNFGDYSVDWLFYPLCRHQVQVIL